MSEVKNPSEKTVYMFHFVSVEVRHQNKYLHFILKLPNCTAVACTNCSMKNSNLSIHKYVISGCKILRVRNSFLRTSISVLHILKKRIDGKYDYGFLCALKLHSQLWENFCTLRMMKNAFYFTSNALFVLKIFKFLSTAWLKSKVNFKFYDVTAWLTNNYYAHIAQHFEK